MSKINIRNLSNENDDGAPDIVGITTFSATSYFVPTRGTTAQRPSDHVEVGSLRYNYDIKNLEYYRGDTIGWVQFELIDPDLGGGTGSNTGVGHRGVLGGGYESYPTIVNKYDYITIPTLGNTVDFGDMQGSGKGASTALGSRERGIYAGGQIPSNVNQIEFITFATTGNGIDFGDLLKLNHTMASGASQTRGIFAGGKSNPSPANHHEDTIQYITIASQGDAVDFGNLTVARSNTDPGGSSSTRAVFARGYSDPAYTNAMDYVNISSTGDAIDFGDIYSTGYGSQDGIVSSATRGIIAGGYDNDSPYNAHVNTIRYITIATTGDAYDFGDLTQDEVYSSGMCSPTRGVFAGGSDPTISNVIDYITIQTLGNALDFGDITTTGRAQAGGCSNGHGGL